MRSFSQPTLFRGFSGCTAYNLGTGKGTSVLQIVAAFEKAAGLVSNLVFNPDDLVLS